MIDYYEKVDFDQEVWVFEDDAIEQQRLDTVCRDHGDPDSKYWAEGCVLYEYRPNRQLPRSVVATFDTEAEAEHAYWLLLLHNVTTTDTAPLLLWTDRDAVRAVDARHEEAAAFGTDKEAGYWGNQLRRVCKLTGIHHWKLGKSKEAA